MTAVWGQDAGSELALGPVVCPVGGTDRVDPRSSVQHPPTGFGGKGSGICVSRTVVVTCHHVVQRVWADVSTNFRKPGVMVDGTGIQADQVRYDQQLDIALLIFKQPIVPRASLLAIGLDPAVEPSLNAAKFSAIGYPEFLGGGRLDVTNFTHMPLNYSAGAIQLMGGIRPGNSGGALIVRSHERSPVIGMPQMSGDEAGATALLTADQIIEFMVNHGLWPDEVAYFADLFPDSGTALSLDDRRRHLAQLFRFPGPNLQLPVESQEPIPFSLLPPAVIPGPDGSPAAVPRPVAIMADPVSRALACWARGEPSMSDDAMRMETDVTCDGALAIAAALGRRLGRTLRLPTAAEWWLGMTAGTGARQRSTRSLYDAGARGAPSFAGVDGNGWQIRCPAPGAREWVRDSEASSAVSAVLALDGQHIVPGHGLTHRAIGFRLVCDLPSGGVGA
jgi:hypothetical protein